MNKESIKMENVDTEEDSIEFRFPKDDNKD